MRWFTLKHIALAAIAVSGAHSHLLCQLPSGREDATVGKVKRYASTQATREDASLPSQLFAGKGEPKPVKNWAHFRTVYEYVTVKHAEEGAWVWGKGEEGLGAMWEQRGGWVAGGNF